MRRPSSIAARSLLVTASLLAANLAVYAQQTAAVGPGIIGAAAAPAGISLRELPGRFLDDQKSIWTFPRSLARGQHILPTLAVVGVTSALLIADPPIMRSLQNTSFGGLTGAFNGTSTAMMIAMAPTALFVEGHLNKDPYAEQTAWLAGEAFFSSTVPQLGIKMATRRLPPWSVAPWGQYTDTFFQGHISPFSRDTSFPSGHATAAFAVATVFAERYRDHRWVRWVAYALAGTISFSRVAEKAHFPSEVFLGSALGYTIARYQVLRNP